MQAPHRGDTSPGLTGDSGGHSQCVHLCAQHARQVRENESNNRTMSLKQINNTHCTRSLLPRRHRNICDAMHANYEVRSSSFRDMYSSTSRPVHYNTKHRFNLDQGDVISTHQNKSSNNSILNSLLKKPDKTTVRNKPNVSSSGAKYWNCDSGGGQISNNANSDDDDSDEPSTTGDSQCLVGRGKLLLIAMCLLIGLLLAAVGAVILVLLLQRNPPTTTGKSSSLESFLIT